MIHDVVINSLQAIAEQSVSTYPSINASDITNMRLVIPSENIVGKYADLASRFIEQMDKNNRESRRLAELRDTLLPKLMSGEIKVNEININ